MANGTEIAKAYVQIIPSMDGISGNLSEALGGTGAAKGLGMSMGDGFAMSFGQAAFNGLVSVGKGIVDFGANSVDVGKEFDKTMSQVAATMGYSIDEAGNYVKEFDGHIANMNGEFEKLSSFAQEMGATTKFSASESAEALNYMALAGYDADTSIKMLPSVLNLAAAGNIDLASASDMVTDSQTALGLSLDETTVMIDQMARISSLTNTDVQQLGDAYLTVGATARSLSGGTAEMSEILGVLADNSIKGAEGGTHLRNIMLAMNPTTDKAVKAWESLGVSAYDAEGNLRPLQDVFTDLNVAMADFSDQEKTEILTKMFNKTDLASVNALLETSADRWDALASEMESASGAAEAMTEVQMDNLAGDIDIFNSALAGLQLVISSQVTPALREFVEFGSDGLSRLTEAFNTGGLDGAMSELGTIISEGLNSVIEKLPDALDAGAELLGAIGQGIINNLPQIVSAALSVVGKLVEYLIQAAPELLTACILIINELALGLSQQLPTLIPTMVDAVITLAMALIDNIDLLIDSAIILIEALANGLIDAAPMLIEKAPEIIGKLVGALLAELPQLVMLALELIIGFAGGMIDALPDLLLAAPKLIEGFCEELADGIVNFEESGGQLIEGLWNGITGKTSWIIEKIKGFGDEVLQGLKDFFGIESPSKVMRDQVGRFVAEGVGVGIEDYTDDAVSSALNMSDEIMGAFDDMNSDMSATLENDMILNKNAIVDVTGAESNRALTDMLQQYLPQIANKDLSVSVEGDASEMFKVMQKQSKIYNNRTGKMAFA